MGDFDSVSAVVLAAGVSSRMGRPKPLVRLAGRPLLDHVLASVRRSRAGHIVVVLGPQPDDVRREVDLAGTQVVINPAYAEGMSTSLLAGIRAPGPPRGAFLVVLGDQPLVASATLDALMDRRRASSARIFVPTYRGVRGNPVLLDGSLSGEMRGIKGDLGCRAIFPDHEDEIEEVAVDDPGILVDVDTEEQLSRIERVLDRGESPASLVSDRVPTRPDLHVRAPIRAHRRAARPAIDVLAMAHEMRLRGEPFALATVVRVVRPTSGRPGNKAIVTSGKELRGWVGGSCAAPVVIAESLSAMRDGRPRVVHLSRHVGRDPPPDGVVEYAMECHSGGAMDIYIEPHLPKVNLLVVGDSPVSSALVPLGRLMDYRVVVVAPGMDPEAVPDADEVVPDLDRLADLATDGTFAVVATMGKHDESAIRALAPSKAAYVGLVASRKRASALLDELAEAGVAREALDRVRSPAGIDLSAETPEEIALSIVAEITKLRRTARVELPIGPTPSIEAATQVAIDPVCGMEVDPRTALSAVHVGTPYYFCSDGCRSRFQEDPHAFLN